MAKISNCKLSINYQKKRFEFFVLEVTVRSVANLIEIHPNMAAFFYKKIATGDYLIYHLQNKNDDMFDDCIELDESYFSGVRKEKHGRGAAGKVAVCIGYSQVLR